MSYAVCISHEAEEDLRGIYAYITFNLLSPKNARGQIDRIEKAILGLNQFSLAHRLVGFEPWRSRGLRIMACDNFLIFLFYSRRKAGSCDFPCSLWETGY
ncbi:MAG: type II toxin-antitoxin system RelE/ParE family toxin [Varibaculum cambriense]|nr:type II toxin-antitoxin system RelE/ParE family toxin [Varibaculum cambriense]